MVNTCHEAPSPLILPKRIDNSSFPAVQQKHSRLSHHQIPKMDDLRAEESKVTTFISPFPNIVTPITSPLYHRTSPNKHSVISGEVPISLCIPRIYHINKRMRVVIRLFRTQDQNSHIHFTSSHHKLPHITRPLCRCFFHIDRPSHRLKNTRSKQHLCRCVFHIDRPSPRLKNTRSKQQRSFHHSVLDPSHSHSSM